MRFSFRALFVCALLMPTRLFDVWGADFRLPTFLILLAIATSTLELNSLWRTRVFAACLTGLLLIRVGFVCRYWSEYQADFQDFRTAIAKIEKGSRVAVVSEHFEYRKNPPPNTFTYWHVTSFAVIDRDVFLPRQFTFPTSLEFTGKAREILTDQSTKTIPLAWKPKDPAFATASQQTISQVETVTEKLVNADNFSSTINWSDWPEHFDYFIDLNYGLHQNPVPDLLTEISRGSYFSIFRIHPPSRH
jgi:hypothetical protein